MRANRDIVSLGYDEIILKIVAMLHRPVNRLKASVLFTLTEWMV